jgi:hypothetical protein
MLTTGFYLTPVRTATIKNTNNRLVEWLKQYEHLPSKHEALSSNPMLPKKKKKKF